MFFLFAFSILSAWYLYFLLWLLPSLTWYRLVVRLRNIAEHASVESNDDRLKNTRTTKANLIERAFIAPYNVHYHLEHHLVVNCPQYNLPIAHQMLVDKGYLPRMEVQSGYPAVLRLAVSWAYCFFLSAKNFKSVRVSFGSILPTGELLYAEVINLPLLDMMNSLGCIKSRVSSHQEPIRSACDRVTP